MLPKFSNLRHCEYVVQNTYTALLGPSICVCYSNALGSRSADTVCASLLCSNIVSSTCTLFLCYLTYGRRCHSHGRSTLRRGVPRLHCYTRGPLSRNEQLSFSKQLQSLQCPDVIHPRNIAFGFP
jgi:hypothetical protein